MARTQQGNGDMRTFKWVIGGLVSIVAVLGAGLFGLHFSHSALEGHPAIAVRVESVREDIAEIKIEQKVISDEIREIHSDVKVLLNR